MNLAIPRWAKSAAVYVVLTNGKMGEKAKTSFIQISQIALLKEAIRVRIHMRKPAARKRNR